MDDVVNAGVKVTILLHHQHQQVFSLYITVDLLRVVG